jgi:hypothetical protein
VVNAETKRNIERSRLDGVTLHRHREEFLKASSDERTTLQNELKAKLLKEGDEEKMGGDQTPLIYQDLLKLYEYDSRMLQDGWLPLLIEQALFDAHNRIAGTPDVVFFHPKKDKFLISDLKHSNIDVYKRNNKSSANFKAVFANISNILDTHFHCASMQLNGYALLLQTGYDQEIRKYFGNNGDQYGIELEILCVHSALTVAKPIQVPYRRNAFNTILAAWHRGNGDFALVKSEVIAKAVTEKLAKSDIKAENTMAGALLENYRKGKNHLSYPGLACIPPVGL